MRWLLASALAVSVFTLVGFAVRPAHALSPVPVTFGDSWDGPTHDLQHIVDAYIGVPGAINVKTDFVGAHAGDPDPWFWVGKGFPSMFVAAIAGNADTNELDWYIETGTKPVFDPSNHGVVFSGPAVPGNSTVVNFPAGTSKFGFVLITQPTISTPAGTYWTNRLYNDAGFQGHGATRPPYDGDVQALVFDVSRWKGPNTWLVCFEDTDAGSPITPTPQSFCTDDDYNDLVFQVTALGATPTQTISFGQLKARYR